ncbi:MAG TPA: hypothetical protein VNZ45_02430, partial [Bacteroidia bacterium]|nr:hypothetical protein [Bacteroidia bacterium]
MKSKMKFFNTILAFIVLISGNSFAQSKSDTTLLFKFLLAKIDSVHHNKTHLKVYSNMGSYEISFEYGNNFYKLDNGVGGYKIDSTQIDKHELVQFDSLYQEANRIEWLSVDKEKTHWMVRFQDGGYYKEMEFDRNGSIAKKTKYLLKNEIPAKISGYLKKNYPGIRTEYV